MIELKPPHRLRNFPTKSIFLAGSIEMGKADNWQAKFVESFSEYHEMIAFNPRRDDWDSSWTQTKDNPKFNEQVTWELDHMEIASCVLFYFQPGTYSPISLMELGICAASGKQVIVVCPEGFWRKGNVDIVCERYNVIQCDSLDDAIKLIKDNNPLR